MEMRDSRRMIANGGNCAYIRFAIEWQIGETMKHIAALLCAVALCGSALAQVTAYKDGEDGVNRTRPGNIKVVIEGVNVAGVHPIENLNAFVAEARGVQTQSSIAAYKDGEDGVNRTRPGNHKPGKITITKDWSNTLEWYTWRKAVIDGKTDRRSVSIILYNDSGVEVGRMNFYNCWPVKHTLPALEAKNSGHATETIELAYDSLEWKGK
jgi:phage tail-like protein